MCRRRSLEKAWPRPRASPHRRRRPTSRHVPLLAEAQRRYLNYAVSVITSRALPDVRDGLKPVQRRILYAMHHDLHLYPDAKFRKCATVVGDVMGKYHPHGDTASYEAMVRMAQAFSMRYPLVDGQGNFGSLDGDRARGHPLHRGAPGAPGDGAARRDRAEAPSTSAPTTTARREEPIVLPARFPQLLVNGVAGIAVGMATNIPPAQPGRGRRGRRRADRRPASSRPRTCSSTSRAPTFPTGGQMHQHARRSCARSTRPGRAPSSCAASGRARRRKRGAPHDHHHLHSVRRQQGRLVEQIAEVIIAKKLPSLVDVRDESTDDVRIVLELKQGADPAAGDGVPLQAHAARRRTFHVNLTCLVAHGEPRGRGARAPRSLARCCASSSTSACEVVTRRVRVRARPSCKRRIHILEGFAKVFDALDEAIRIIRKSEGKADAAEKLMARFELDEEQTDAILELRLYSWPAWRSWSSQTSWRRSAPRPRKSRRILKSHKRSCGRWCKDELAGDRASGSPTSAAPRSAARRRRARVRRRGLHRRRGRHVHPHRATAGSSACAR